MGARSKKGGLRLFLAGIKSVKCEGKELPGGWREKARDGKKLRCAPRSTERFYGNKSPHFASISHHFHGFLSSFLNFLSLRLNKCLDYFREIGNTILNRAKNLADNRLAVSFQASGCQQFGNSDK